MKSNNRNVRKKHILAILNCSEPLSAKKITDLCYPITLSSICSSLKNYYNQGLLKRKRENKHAHYEYQITTKGSKKLEYLIGDTSIKSQIELLVREKIRL